MEIPLLFDLFIIFCLAMLALLAAHQFKVPSILAFLITGILVGPHGLGLIHAVHEVEVLAEIGVVLLLFTIGIEFSLGGLLRVRKAVLVGGTLQLLLTLLCASSLVWWAGRDGSSSIFIGFLVVLSSTAIVLKQLQEKAEIDTPHGRLILAVLIFQDLLVAPMMLLTPLLAGQGGSLVVELPLLLIKSVGVLLLVWLLSRYLVPQLLFAVARTRSRETFLICIVAIGLAIAWATSSIGLSFALGAFLAGLIISESEYSHHALSSILPFRDVFTSLFFVSIGMLFDVRFLFQEPLLVLGLTLAVILGKGVLATLAVSPLGYPLHIWLIVGFSLGQVGEFSFILSRVGIEYGLLDPQTYQLFLAVSIVTMALTPLLMNSVPRLIRRRMAQKVPDAPYSCLLGNYNDHVIIIGYGVNGHNLARAARTAGIPYAILEMNPDTVQEERAKGEPIYFGDAAHPEVLEQAAIRCARVVVVAVSDPVATRQAVVSVRHCNSSVRILVRTKYLAEVDELTRLGADEVIPEEFEASVEIFTRILERYLTPRDEIERFVAEIRAHDYEMLRRVRPKPGAQLLKDHLPDVDISTLRIRTGSALIGCSLLELDLRRTHAITVLAIQVDGQWESNPNPDRNFSDGDLLTVLGTPVAIADFSTEFIPPPIATEEA